MTHPGFPSASQAMPGPDSQAHCDDSNRTRDQIDRHEQAHPLGPPLLLQCSKSALDLGRTGPELRAYRRRRQLRRVGRARISRHESAWFGAGPAGRRADPLGIQHHHAVLGGPLRRRCFVGRRSHPALAGGPLDRLVSERFTLADIAAGTCLHRDFNLGLEVERPAHVLAWWARLQQREAFRKNVALPFDALFGRLTY